MGWVIRSFLIVFSLFLSVSWGSNPWPNGEVTPALSTDGSAPVSRGYIIPSVEQVTGGAKLMVDIYHQVKQDPVTLILQAVVNDGQGGLLTINLRKLHDQVVDNPDNYNSHREFILNYDELNQLFRKAAPNAPNLIIGPGVPLFVYATFNGGHEWGGPMRCGVFFLPGSDNATVTNNGTGSTSRPVALDIAYPLSQALANIYNADRGTRGLKVGGQSRSRVEAEGKYQLDQKAFSDARRILFQLSKDPQEAQKILGPEWALELETRYLQKDSNGQLVMDAEGFPIPDPMVDTYYDNSALQAASSDMALRYRWTNGNKTGAWNFKPGMGLDAGDGIVYRVEFGLDTTDDKPESLKLFADSNHPLNPFRWISSSIPGARPSSFFQPAVRITDYRYKFLLKHTSGLIIEVSADDVRADSLRDSRSQAHFYQLEMDIDHLAVASRNVGNQQTGNFQGRGDIDAQAFAARLQGLTQAAFLDGRPTLHQVEDLQPTSPLRVARKAEFDVASEAIRRLRDRIVGDRWVSGAQKYAFSAYTLGLVTKEKASPSVIKAEAGGANGAVNDCAAQLAASG